MRIAIDASPILPPRTGIGNYTWQLIRALLDFDALNEYVLFLNSLRRPLPDNPHVFLKPNLRVRRWRLPGPMLHRAWKRWHRPSIERLAGPAEVYFAPASILPPRRTHTPLIATLHDCYFMRHPEHCHALGGLYMRDTLPEGLKHCDGILCVSEFTRQEALNFFDLDPDRVGVALPGIDRSFFKPCQDPERLEQVRKRYSLPRKFLLSVATREPRKNFDTLLRANAHLRNALRRPPCLVCVGNNGHQSQTWMRLLRKLRLGPTTHFTGFVADEDMPVIYSLALATVLPSVYEGFDLPVLESMACGTPVIASDIPAHREAARDAAFFVPSRDAQEMGEAMRRLAMDESVRLEYRRRGLRHVEAFPWRETARDTLSTFERILIARAR